MKKTLALLLAVVMTVAMLAGCGSQPAASSSGTSAPESSSAAASAPAGEPKTLVIQITGDPQAFNPTLQSDDNLYPAAQNMYHRLTCLDSSKSVVPEAADEWSVSEDGLHITFKLKDKLAWWDGEPLTSKDVKYTFDYVKDHPETYFSSSMNIVDTIDTPDDYTVVFNMNTVDVSFIARLGWYGTFILPEHIFNNGQDWADNPASTTPLGSGPFKFESYNAGTEIVLVANEDYAYGVPQVDRLVFSIIPDEETAMQALINGEIDYLEMIPAAYVDEALNNPDLRLVLDQYPSPWRFIFNTKADIVSDVAVRRAIAYCVNREDISAKASGGIMPPEYSVYPAIVAWAANTEDTYPKQDIAMAQQILEEAGYTKDANGFYVTGITWDVFEGMEDMVKLIIASCAEAGIGIEMNLMEYNAWSAKVGDDRNFQIEAQGGFMGPDPAALSTRYGTDSNSNYAGWSNPEFDELCRQAAATGDQAVRADLYKKAQKLVLDDMIAVNVLAYADYQGMSANVHDMPIDGVGKWSWADYSHVYFD